VPTHKFVKFILGLVLLFAIPFFLMVYCLRCERLRLSSQKRAIDRIIEEQRMARHYAKDICRAFESEVEEND
jgi:hypothetical protein